MLRLAKQHCFCLGANSELHRLPHHRGDAAVSRARRNEWSSFRGKRPALASGRNPVVRIAHIRASMLAEDGVVERDFRKHCEEKPGNASA